MFILLTATYVLGRSANRDQGSGSYSAAQAAAPAPCVCLDGVRACRLLHHEGAAADHIRWPCAGGLWLLSQHSHLAYVFLVALYGNSELLIMLFRTASTLCSRCGSERGDWCVKSCLPACMLEDERSDDVNLQIMLHHVLYAC